MKIMIILKYDQTQNHATSILKNRRMQKMCYSPDPGTYGWCGTCYNGELSPGEEGYCDYYTGIEIIYFELYLHQCVIHKYFLIHVFFANILCRSI